MADKEAVNKKDLSSSNLDIKSQIKDFTHSFHLAEKELLTLNNEIKKIPTNEKDNEKLKAIQIKIKATHKLIEDIKRKTEAMPEIAEALGIGVATPKIDNIEIIKAVEPTILQENSVTLKNNKSFVATKYTGVGPRDSKIVVDEEIKLADKVGKLRIQFNGDDGSPAPNASYILKLKKTESDDYIYLRSGRTDIKGYTSLNLSDINLNDVEELKIVIQSKVAPEGGVNKALSHTITNMELVAGLQLAYPFFVPVPKDLIDKLNDWMESHDGGDTTGTIEDPDDIDVSFSPDSFGLNADKVDGNCCLRPRTEFPAKEYYLRQTVRLTDIEDVKLVFSGKDEIARQEVSAPLSFGDESATTYAKLGGNIIVGLSNLYRHGWYQAGRGLGRLLYSTSLAPCEDISLAFIDWTRRERDSRTESRTQTERFEHDLQHDRSIDEVVDSTLQEHQDGSTGAGGGGASLDLGVFSIGGGGGHTSSETSGRRDLHVSTSQSISDSVSQRASALRHQRATVVTTSYQSESERIKTRRIHNHNLNHIMNLQYFQVVEHYAVKTELVEEKPILLIPYQVDQDIFGTISNFDSYVLKPSQPITRFLDRHSRILRRLVPWKYRRSFQSLSRLLHCKDVYSIEKPFATFSRWDINLKDSWKTSINLRIKTKSGQSIRLKPKGATKSKPPRYFVSTPVKDSDIESLVISFDISDVTTSIDLGFFSIGGISSDVLDGMFSNLTEHKIKDVEIYATTDRSRYIKQPQSFLIETNAVNTTLKASNSSVVVGITSPSVDFSDYRGREHQDYCRLQELIAHIQSYPMRYMRAIWLREDPDRRAIRFDQYQLGDTSLLDRIVNKPIGILGNYVAFELLNGHKLVALQSPDYVSSSRVVTIPTRGVFGEVFLSCCNATEKRDVERMLTSEERCQRNAPDITGVSPSSRASRSNTTPTDFAAPIVNLQNTPAVPNPTGMANATSVLSTPDIFRDLSNGAELISFIDNATKEAFTSTRQHRAAMDAIAGDVVRGLVSAYTGTPISSSGTPQSASSGTTGITSSPNSGGGNTPNITSGDSSSALEALTGQMVRQSSPTQVGDHVQTVRRAIESGLLSESQGNAITNSLLGGKNSSAISDSTAPSIILTTPTTRDGLAFGAIANNKTGNLTLSTNVVGAPDGATYRWSRPNPASMEISDPNELSTEITPLLPGVQEVGFIVRDTSSTILASIRVPLSVPQFILVREETAQFEAVLNSFGLNIVKQAILEKAKQVSDLLLSTANIRTIWEMAPFSESLPSQFATGGASSNRVSIATLRGNPPSSGLAGRTSKNTGAISDTDHDEIISVWPGAFNDPVASGAAGDVDDATRQIVQVMQGLDYTDLRLNNLAIEIFGRLIGETLAHEILHSIIGFRIPSGHNTPAIAHDIMNNGVDRSFQNRTGIEILDITTFPDEGSYFDTGEGFINIPTSSTQQHINTTFPTDV